MRIGQVKVYQAFSEMVSGVIRLTRRFKLWSKRRQTGCDKRSRLRHKYHEAML
ncbi:MAG: hypothetical protein ICV63_03390 [Coleofasciculus sp. Co-bin14]|nr:hypothetical protein [Coleofasciculus sp. Co-bin14]